MALTIVPSVVSGQTVRSVGPGDSAQHAARQLTEHDISSLVVVEDGDRLVGIVTERDLARRVVAENRPADQVLVADIMSNPVETLAPGDNPLAALETMRRLHIRHLPIVDAGRVVGMVSIRDVRRFIGAHEAARPRSVTARILRKLSG